jgi:hypothetical protein
MAALAWEVQPPELALFLMTMACRKNQAMTIFK